MTWDAELLLPEDVEMKSGESSTRTRLTYTDEVTFNVRMKHHVTITNPRVEYGWGESRRYQAVLVVTVYNGSDTPILNDDNDAQGRYHFPVTLFADHLPHQ